jgi:hypothetical protein
MRRCGFGWPAAAQKTSPTKKQAADEPNRLPVHEAPAIADMIAEQKQKTEEKMKTTAGTASIVWYPLSLAVLNSRHRVLIPWI